MYIPDVSHWHPVRDWATVKKECPFIITKATQGTSYVDSTLKSFAHKAEDWGVPYWLYVFLNKWNEKAQTEYMVKKCKPLVGDFFRGYVLDVESGNTAAGVKNALDYLRDLGGKHILYTMYAQYGKYKTVIDNRGSTVAWWEARYGVNNGNYNPGSPCHRGVDLHQYTSKGYCPGIGGTTDLSRLTGELPLTWFTNKGASKKASTKKKGYEGAFPTLPARGYYKYGDGFKDLRTKKSQIKRVQSLVSWITGDKIAIDGMYGAYTELCVKAAQKMLGVKSDGLFGPATLAGARLFKK